MPASGEAAPVLPGLSPICGRPIEACFDGGPMSFDGGLLVLRQIERRLGIAGRLAACIHDPRVPDRIAHGLDGVRGRIVYQDIYCARGRAENHIKSWKTHLGACWLMWTLRTALPRRSLWRVARFDTLRPRPVKLAAVDDLRSRVDRAAPAARLSRLPCTRPSAPNAGSRPTCGCRGLRLCSGSSYSCGWSATREGGGPH
jgi:hypothetical protein